MFLAATASFHPAYAAFDHTYSPYTQELKNYVDHSLVHYNLWRKHSTGLESYLSTLAAVSPKEYSQFTIAEKKAFWINAYNAITIAIVLKHYPIRGNNPEYPANSLRQIANVWDNYRYQIMGHRYSLNDILHDVIRREFQDPRIHFAIVCAARGSPCLKNSAYLPATIDHDLEDATREYFKDPSHVRFDIEKREMVVSKLFKWFPLDFTLASGLSTRSQLVPRDEAIVWSYVLSYVPIEIKERFVQAKPTVTYMPFDWSLNDADVLR